jgi:hypothetical protein
MRPAPPRSLHDHLSFKKGKSLDFALSSHEISAAEGHACMKLGFPTPPKFLH